MSSKHAKRAKVFCRHKAQARKGTSAPMGASMINAPMVKTHAGKVSIKQTRLRLEELAKYGRSWRGKRLKVKHAKEQE